MSMKAAAALTAYGKAVEAAADAEHEEDAQRLARAPSWPRAHAVRQAAWETARVAERAAEAALARAGRDMTAMEELEDVMSRSIARSARRKKAKEAESGR